MANAVKRMSTTVCIAGGGPAGMLLGLLLARADIDVIVLEKHLDFFRDFRGDTIHPSTIDVIEQLGLRDRLQAIPHTAVSTLDAVIKGVRITPVDFGSLRHGANRLLFMPQWDLLDLLASAAREHPKFHLLMGAEATGLVEHEGLVTGVTARTQDGEVEISTTLAVAADGRSSTLRDAAGLTVEQFGVPIDVLWLRLPRPAENPPDTIVYVSDEAVVVTIPRTDYYQTAVLIPKGGFAEIRDAGIEAFRATISDTVPFLTPSVDDLASWDQVQLLSVQIDRLERWHKPGFLAVGDAAHAMSPAFGVGINYAIQDAVAAANILVGPLRRGVLDDANLAAVQERREAPVRRMQSIQLRLHTVVGRPGGGRSLPSAARIRRVTRLFAPLARPITARLIGRGFRPERVSDEVLGPPGG